MFRLNDDGTLVKPTADYILGKPSEHARRSHAGAWSEVQTEFPGTLAVDHTNQRLFVVDNSTGQSSPDVGSQIMVFDIHPDRIRTGEPVLAVLGQPDADTKTRGLAANHVGRRLGLAIDEVSQRLFAADGSNNRVLVFDIRPGRLETGMDASLVLGQTDFTSNAEGLGPSRFTRPGSLAYDATNQRLFVSDNGNNRVLVFDARPSELRTNASAVDVMGQRDFQSRQPRTDLDGFATGGLAYDDRTNRLFIAEQVSRIEHMRIVVYDVAPGADLRRITPQAVLGKPGFGAYDPIVSRDQSVWPRLGSASIDSERQLLVATEGYPGGNRAIIWDISPDRLRNGMPAVEVVGHIDDEGHSDFERRSANDRATPRNVYPRDVALDPVDHRLFAIDQYNNRVLVWQLDSQNRVLDRDAKWVIGQPDLYSGELYPVGPTTIKIPLAVTYDPHHKRVFVSDGWGNRIMVFDARPERMTDGPAAIAVIGQPDFTSVSPATTQTGIDFDTRVGTGITPGRPRGTGLTYDPIHDRLFASDGGNHRVLVYDVAPDRLRSGLPASVVIGQPNFTSSSRNSTATGLYQPAALLYESKQQRLFVSDGNNNRVLVFDARPEVLANGPTPTVVIGQPDFASFAPGRSRHLIDGPDGLAYDYAHDRLFVSDHGSDRVLLFDAHPERLDNGPEAQFVIGQQDFTSRELGPVRANEIWDPRGLAFDSDHQRLYVSQGFASNIMIHDMARPTYEFELRSRGVQSYQAAGADTEVETQEGFAVASGGDALAGGTAVFTVMKTQFDELSQRESRVLISEEGVGAPVPSRRAMIFVDGESARETFLGIANPGSRSLTLTFVQRNENGVAIGNAVSRELEGRRSVSLPLSALLPQRSTGSVTVEGTGEFGLMATRVTRNDRGEEIVSAVPVAYGTPGASSQSLTLPHIQNGGGYHTQVVLLNPTETTFGGTLQLFSARGEAMNAGGSASVTPVSVAPRGTFVWESDGMGNSAETGYAVISSTSGRVEGGAIIGARRGETLISEQFAGSGEVREGWFPIDTYPSVVRHGQTAFRLTVTNSGTETADVRLLVYDPDGELLTRSFQILPAGRQVEFTQVDLIDRGKFKGSVRVVSDVPVSLSAAQRTRNVRGEVVVSALPSMTSGVDSSGNVVFPVYADGPEVATQIFVLNRDAEGKAQLRFVAQDGEALLAILR